MDIEEVSNWALLEVAAFPSSKERFRESIERVLGARLPRQMGVITQHNGQRVFRTGAASYWILSSQQTSLHDALRSCLAPDVGAVLPLSDSRARFALSGPQAGPALAKCLSLDLHPEAFRVDHYVLTGLHSTPVLVHKVEADRFEIYTLRTFARSVLEYLRDAS